MSRMRKSQGTYASFPQLLVEFSKEPICGLSKLPRDTLVSGSENRCSLLLVPLEVTSDLNPLWSEVSKLWDRDWERSKVQRDER